MAALRVQDVYRTEEGLLEGMFPSEVPPGGRPARQARL